MLLFPQGFLENYIVLGREVLIHVSRYSDFLSKKIIQFKEKKNITMNIKGNVV